MARTSTPPPRPHPKSPSPRRGPHPLTPSPQRGEGERKGRSSGEDSKGGHALAKQVSGAGVQVPDDPAQLAKLPGVGPYTAGAVASFAYEKPVPAVDTNVNRVLRRVFFDRATGNGQRATQVWELARALVPKDGKRAWKVNQAIMELGALVCVGPKTECEQWP